MKALIVGANGQLGSDLVLACQRHGWGAVPLTHNELQVENIESVRRSFAEHAPDVILNTAAFHNVPLCEQDPLRAYHVNALGALNIARVCGETGAVPVYYSTDYVFDGTKGSPYVEEDRPNPLNVYAGTKLLGEYATLNYARNGIVIRISGIYGKVPCRAKGGNFITTMVKAAREKPEVRVVTDEILAPTPTSAIASKSFELLDVGVFGLFHMVSEGECSWYEFARVIFETLDFKTPLRTASVKDFPSPVRRPSYSALSNSRLKSAGGSAMPHWRDGLVAFLREQYLGRNA